MKKIILLISLFFIVSCDDEPYNSVFHDIGSTYINIAVVDKEGNNLLDPEYENNILGNNILMTYKGVTYSLLDNDDQWETKAVPLGEFRGMMTNTRQNLAVIGYFDPKETINVDEFRIDWGNGTNSLVKYYQKFRWKDNKKSYEIERRYWVNGVEIKGDIPAATIEPHITVVLAR